MRARRRDSTVVVRGHQGGVVLGVGCDLVLLDLAPEARDPDGEAGQDQAGGLLVVAVDLLAPGVSVADEHGHGLLLGIDDPVFA